MTMVPEAWQNDSLMPADKKAFYRWSAFAMEPWDGPGKIISLCLKNVGFQPDPTQTSLNSHRRWLEASSFGFKKKRDCTVYEAFKMMSG